MNTLAREEILFVRPASGLVRTITPALSWALAVPGNLMPYIWVTIALAPVWYPGANWLIALAIGALGVLIYGLGLTLATVAIPRSGGYYVLMARCVHPLFGSFEPWRGLINNAIGLAGIAYLTGLTLPAGLVVIGKITGSTGLVAIGSAIGASVLAKAVLGFIVAGASITASYLGPRILVRWMAVWGAIALIGVVVLLGVFATHSPDMIPATWDSVWGSGAYQEVVDVATKNGYIDTPFSWSATTSAIFLALFMVYSDVSSPVAGEVAKPKLSIPIVNIIVPAIIFGIIGIASYQYSYTYGNFADMYSYIIGNGFGDQFVINEAVSEVSVTFFGSCLTKNPLICGIIMLTPILSAFGGLNSWTIFATRPLFALAFDRMAPESFTALNRFHAPKNILHMYTAIVVIALIASIAGYSIEAIYSSFLGFLVVAIFIAMSYITLPYQRPDDYKRGFNWWIGPFPVISLCGVICLIIYMLPLYSESYDMSSILVTSIIFALSALWFLAYSYINRKRGLDVREIYAEIPPE